jgi:hypothetical protein
MQRSSLTRVALLAALLTGCGGTSQSAITAPGAVPATVAVPTPAGPTAMRGTVADAAFRPIVNARIEVLDGPQAGMTTTSDGRGEFSFVGNFDDDMRFRATRDGYTPAIQRLQALCLSCAPNRWVHFTLDLLTAGIDMGGEYTVTFNSKCAAFPSEVRTRTFTTTIQSAPYQGQIAVPLRGGTFLEGWDTLPMGVVSDYVAFWIEVIVEKIAPDTYVTVNALAAATVGTAARSTFTFPLDGTISYCVTKPNRPYEDCYRNDVVISIQCPSAEMVLTRR